MEVSYGMFTLGSGVIKSFDFHNYLPSENTFYHDMSCLVKNGKTKILSNYL